MDQALNPYSPGAGIRPLVLAGREPELELIRTMATRTERGLHNRGVILHGLRGVGKTVLLNEMAGIAEKSDWLTVQFEASADANGNQHVRSRLARELAQSARKLSARKRWSHMLDAIPVISSFSATLGFTGVSFDAELQKGRGDSGDISLDLEELVLDVAAAAKKDGKALAFFIDEMQDLDHELLSAIITAQHQAGQKDLPFYVIGAGLPTLPSVLATSHSYSERLFSYRPIGTLNEISAASALVEPADASEAEFTDEALASLLKASGKYPYFLQEFGSAIWDIAPESPFTLEDAQLAIGQGTDALDHGFFPSRWERATAAERRLLAAMSEFGNLPAAMSDIAKALDVAPNSLGTSRKGLILKGLVFSPQLGQLQFTVPGMAEFIRRNAEDAQSEG